VKHESVVRMFERCAAEYADRTAISYLDRWISYDELESRADQLAGYLKASGAPRGALVAILCADPVMAITSILGILKAGCAFVPLDTTTPEKRLAPMVALTEPEWFIVEPDFVQLAINLTGVYDSEIKLVCTEAIDLPEVDDRKITFLTGLAEHADKRRPNIESDPDDLCYVYFTSGSTGAPKAIAGRLKGIDHFIRWEIETLGVNEHTRISQLLAHSFDGSLRDIFVSLCSGGTICVPPDKEVLLDIRRLINWIDSERINIIHCVPSLFRAIVNEELRPELFPALQYVLMAGEALLPSDVRRWIDVFGERVQLINLYGTSETTMAKFIYFVKRSDTERRFISIGRPMEGAAVLLVDAKGRPCPQGTIGEIYIRTPYRSLGYYNQPELTAKAFIPNPFSDDLNDIVYKTGDLGRAREDGNYEYLGRQDQQVKIRGVRVELEEIEDLLRGHESVKDIAVIDRHDGSNFTYLCAYVVFSNGNDPAELRDYAAARLQDYMVPSAFVVMDELPRTISGKVDRRALPAVKQREKGKPDPARTPLEELLCGIWGEVLGLSEIGRQDNFFELGGHSLSATRVMSRVRAVTGQALALRELFEAPTVALLAGRLERLQTGRVERAGEPGLPAREDRSLPAPLSSAQQRLWFIDQLEPGSAAYNIPAAVRLRGALNIEALRSAFRALASRQEGLRTIFPLQEGEPVQVVQALADWPLPLVDLRGGVEAEREKELRELTAAEAERGFELGRGPLLRSRLVQLGEQEYVLLLVMHHIISDGWSLGLMVQELATHYEHFAGGAARALPELRLQYADYAQWQRGWLGEGKLTSELQYWQQSLAGAPPLLELPLDRARGAVLGYRGGAVSVALGAELSQGLKELARRQGATLFMVLLAAFKTLLYRYTGQTDLVVGTPVAGRLRPELEAIIGLFVNTLALRTRLSGAESFRELLSTIRETALGAYAHQELPFDTLVEELQPERSLSHHPLFQVMFIVQNTPTYMLSLPGLTLSAEPFTKSTAQFDLVLSMTETKEELAASAQYSTNLFNEATIKNLLDHYRNLLASVVKNPEGRLADLTLITSEEHELLTKQLNDTEAPYPGEASIQEIFERQVNLNADGVAIIDDESQLFYSELNRRSNQLAHHLIRLGVGPESLVGVLMDRSVESVIALLGIVKAGGAYVPLDSSYPKDRLAYMVGDSGAKVLLTKARFVETLPEHGALVIRIDADWDRISQQSTDNPPLRAKSQHPAYVIYTSGSTGQPKGVLGLHRGAVNRFHWMWTRYPFTGGEVCCQKTSLSFVDAVWEVFGPLLQGVPSVIFSDDVIKDTDRFIDKLARHGVTRLVLVPSLLRVILDARDITSRLSKLNYCVCSGETLPAELARTFQQRLPECTLLNLYGSSEVSADATYHEVAKDEAGTTVSIGRPLSNVQVYILDAHRRPLPIGAKGELYVGGDALARGYVQRPDLTAERFIPDAFGGQAGARLYRTGDMARLLAGGDIEYLGRADHQVKVRGYRIELEEIEAILKQHEVVREVIVQAREDVPTDVRLTAYIVAEQSDEKTIGILREYLRGRLPEYMMPAAFVLMDALPLMPNGKVNRHALPAPQRTADLEKEFQPPRSTTEQEIAALWTELLAVERVGIDDNFFELGGHSLLATQMISRVRMNFGVDLDVKRFFLSPTITTLAELVEQNLFAATDQSKLVGMLELIDDLKEDEAQRLALGK